MRVPRFRKRDCQGSVDVGFGKTMLARRLPTILPNLSLDEALETTKIHSVAGILAAKTALIATRPRWTNSG
jgi:predicted ATPase with chaperone activity